MEIRTFLQDKTMRREFQMIVLTLLCMLCVNIAAAQNVRQKPVVKKQTTTTTTTKQTTSTPKKQNKSVSKNNSSPVRNVQLQDLFSKPFGFYDIDLQSKSTSFATIKATLTKKYKSAQNSRPADWLWICSSDNPSLKNIYYNGLFLYEFSLSSESYCHSWYSSCWRSIDYCFDIYKSKMNKSWSEYLDAIVNDFHQLDIPITYKKISGDKCHLAEGKLRVGNVEYKIEACSFSNGSYTFYIRQYLLE